METASDALDLARDLAMKGLSAEAIRDQLQERGYQESLHAVDIERIVSEARAAASLLPKRSSRVWPRVVGVMAVLGGTGGVLLGDMGAVAGRYHPAGWGVLAILLGLILIIKPDWGDEPIT